MSLANCYKYDAIDGSQIVGNPTIVGLGIMLNISRFNC